MQRRRFLGTVLSVGAGGLAGCGASADSTPGAFRVTSPALVSGDPLPRRFTCDGAGRSPPFVVERVPGPTAALAVVAEYDRGVINEPVFWSLWNVPADTDRIPAGLPRSERVDSLGDARQGRQPGGEPGYEPPCPPTGQPYEHRYQVYALGEEVSVDAGANHEPATEAIGDVVLASRRFTVVFERTPTP